MPLCTMLYTVYIVQATYKPRGDAVAAADMGCAPFFPIYRVYLVGQLRVCIVDCCVYASTHSHHTQHNVRPFARF